MTCGSVIETQSKTKSQLHPPNCQNFYEDSSKFELDNVKTQLSCETSSRFELATSKTKQFCMTSCSFERGSHQKKECCKTSSIFEVDNNKNEAILLNFLQIWIVECRADSLLPMRFAIFLVYASKVLHLLRYSLFCEQ